MQDVVLLFALPPSVFYNSWTLGIPNLIHRANAMPTGYYLVCPETHRYVWIGTLGDTTSAAGVDAVLVSSFCLVHRNKSLIVVNESHQAVEEGYEWAL